MCGITGVIAFTDNGKPSIECIEQSVKSLAKRGPDGNGIYVHENVALGHTRLSIIDVSNNAAQPFTDETGRYTIIFNGEFYNYAEHRKALEQKGLKFRSTSDTEVLLHLYIQEGASCLEKVNGFFAFAIYDKQENSLFIARDRFGIKPLLYYRDEDKFIFASEMKSLIAFGISKEMDQESLFSYLQLNYIPGPDSIFKRIKKLKPGHFLFISAPLNELPIISDKTYYEIPLPSPFSSKGTGVEVKKTGDEGLSYEAAQSKLVDLMSQSVQLRLISDVPLGAFLSGGIDSSIIVALASQFTKQLNTFSIGYKDEPLFDETHYAKLVANKYKTNHIVFSLSNNDLFANLHKVLEYIDEPFADSSALAVNILSMHTRKHVTVALSGDGADELFSGYNKHAAEYKARHAGILAQLVKVGTPLWKILPQSRNSKLGNIARQLYRFGAGMQLSAKDRYWRWATFVEQDEALQMLKEKPDLIEFAKRRNKILENIHEEGNMNDVLYTDMHLVLQNDMLTKVDLMSMENGLEVRVPFLDWRVVNFVMNLPESYKIDAHTRKKILQDAFRKELPKELYHRPKQGFEVPLLRWFRTELKSMITDDLLSDKFIKEQNIFNLEAVQKIKTQLFSDHPGDVHAQIWALIVFQYWWKKYMA